MRALTFLGFLKSYVRELSLSHSTGVRVLAKEAVERNPRLRELLYLYALLTGQIGLLQKSVRGRGLAAAYVGLPDDPAEMERHLQAERGVSNYRLYTSLGLNPGNLNAWLKHGDGREASLQTARAVFEQARSYG